VVHELYGSSATVRRAVRERFGESVLDGDRVDRAALAERAFATAEERAWLEGLLWPLVGERIASWRAEQERRTPPPRALVVEVPLLFEAGMEGGFDATVAVVADEALRTRRAAERGHRALDERSARQLTQAEKAARARWVVTNDGGVEQLEAKLSAILEMLSG
jgi:dephospho-CoA kinase